MQTWRMPSLIRCRIGTLLQAKGSVEKILEQEGYQLKIRLSEAGDSYTVDEWALSKKWEQKETINNLWQGF